MGGWIERGARKAKRYVMYTRGRMKKKGGKQSQGVSFGD
jgi:hypothetical protein